MIGALVNKMTMLFKKEKKVPIYNSIPNGKMLDGKIAFLTGGTGGIGRAIAKKIICDGGKVIVAGRNQEKLI